MGHYTLNMLWFKTLSKTTRFVLLVALVWLLIVGTFYGWVAALGMSMFSLAALMVSFAASYPWLPVLFLALYVVRPLLFLPTSLFAVLAGMMFEFWVAVLFTLTGMMGSALITYGIARSWVRGAQHYENGRVAAWRSYLTRKPFETVLLMHLSFLPFDLVNYSAGMLRIGLPSFIAGVLLGSLPSALGFISIGASININTLLNDGITLRMLDPFYLFLALVVAALSLIGAHIARKYIPSDTPEAEKTKQTTSEKDSLQK